MASQQLPLGGDQSEQGLLAQSYSLQPDEIAFFKSQTGINDDAALKEHILAVQAKAYEIWPYPCIQRLSFTKLRISRLPAYKRVLKLGRDRPSAILLDIGCCFGNDVRKAIADGYPAQNVIASDLRPEFWTLGHVLFKSTPETFPVPFISGDIFDPAHIHNLPPFYGVPPTPAPALPALTSLIPLHGQVSVVYASAFFHLFSEEKQLLGAQKLASLMSPLPGSIIFGQHVALPEKGVRTELPRTRGNGMFCHSPESWQELWNGEVFEKGTVRVDARLIYIPESVHIMFWSVVRV